MDATKKFGPIENLLLQVKRSVNFETVFWVIDFLQKTNERIRLYYYDTSGRLVFVRFLEEIDDYQKTISKLTDL